MGLEPTNDGYEPPALTTIAIRSLLLVPFWLVRECIIFVSDGWCIRQDAFVIITKGIRPLLACPENRCSVAKLILMGCSCCWRLLQSARVTAVSNSARPNRRLWSITICLRAAVCAFRDLRIPPGQRKITEKKLRTYRQALKSFSAKGEYRLLRKYVSLINVRKVWYSSEQRRLLWERDPYGIESVCFLFPADSFRFCRPFFWTVYVIKCA